MVAASGGHPARFDRSNFVPDSTRRICAEIRWRGSDAREENQEENNTNHHVEYGAVIVPLGYDDQRRTKTPSLINNERGGMDAPLLLLFRFFVRRYGRFRASVDPALPLDLGSDPPPRIFAQIPSHNRALGT